MAPDTATLTLTAEDLADDVPVRHHHHAWTTTVRLLHHKLFVTGLTVFVLFTLVAVLAPWIAPVDPNKLAMRYRFLPHRGITCSGRTISVAACGRAWCGAHSFQ